MKRKIIFIRGIRGSGKGTISKNICSNTSIIPLTASDLIKWNEMNVDSNNKKVNNILNTQERLIKGLNSIVNNENVYLLDGHFCLLNKNNEPERVPLSTFR